MNTSSHSEPSYSVPKNVFLHLLMMSMLYVSVISLIALYIAYINILLPDEFTSYLSQLDSIRISSSTLIVGFPIFIGMNWLIQKEMKLSIEVKKSKIRKWLIYLTLFVAAITIAVDLIRLVFNFYNGDLTLPFALKVICVLLIVSCVLYYYILDVNDRVSHKRLLAYISSFVVLLSLVVGFVFAGTPAEQRKIRLDQQRVNELSDIQWRIINYWQSKSELPPSIDALVDPVTRNTLPVDPLSAEPYVYEKLGDLKFKLCANFQAKSVNDNGLNRVSSPRPDMANSFWEHPEGYYCFESTIDPELYRPYKDVPTKP